MKCSTTRPKQSPPRLSGWLGRGDLVKCFLPTLATQRGSVLLDHTGSQKRFSSCKKSFSGLKQLPRWLLDGVQFLGLPTTARAPQNDSHLPEINFGYRNTLAGHPPNSLSTLPRVLDIRKFDLLALQPSIADLCCDWQRLVSDLIAFGSSLRFSVFGYSPA